MKTAREKRALVHLRQGDMLDVMAKYATEMRAHLDKREHGYALWALGDCMAAFRSIEANLSTRESCLLKRCPTCEEQGRRAYEISSEAVVRMVRELSSENKEADHHADEHG